MRRRLCYGVVLLLALSVGYAWGQSATTYRTTDFHEWWAHAVGTNVLLEVHDHGRVWRGSVDDMLQLMFPRQGITVNE